jgi:type II secretory pathway pseudopilin PulG
MKQPLAVCYRHSSEEGYILLVAIFLLALLSLALSVAVPVVARKIQLDREHETMERGKQYERAIQLYYRKFHTYPPSIDALVMTNNIRFLRKRYTDPMTGEDDWQPILFGHNQTPTAMGFFGQPLNGVGLVGSSTLAGIGPSGGNGFNGGADSLLDNGTTNRTADTGPDSLGAATTGTNPTEGIGSSTSSEAGSDPSTGQNGQTFSGVGIIGFSPGSARQSIMIYKKKNHFDEWEFTYDPIGDPTLQANAAPSLGSSVVGTGCGPSGTGPVISPCPGSPTTGNSPP